MRVLMLWALSLCLLSTAHAKTYYFSSVSGNDSRSATQAQNPSTPWKSINKLNAIFYLMRPGDKILFKRGETFYGTITPTKSGTASAPITIGAYGSGDDPIITGFVTLSNWTSIGSGRYEATHSALGSSVATVTLNDVAQEIGRYPNSNAPLKGYLIFEGFGTNSFKDNELPSSPNWTGAEVVIRNGRSELDRLKVSSHSGSTITFSPSTSYPIKKAGWGYFFQNDVRTLDRMGEWAYKASTKEFSMYFGSNNPSNYTVKASVLKNVLYLHSKSYIVFENLSFEGANEDALYIYNTTGTKVRNCSVQFAGIDGIRAAYTTNLQVENSNISNNNNNGIFLIGSNNASIIRNNTIRNSGVFPGMCQNGGNNSMAIRDNGIKTLIEYNTIENTGYCGMRFTGDYTVIKNNVIKNFGLTKDDGGGIYTGGTAGVTGVGRKIQGNIVVNGIGAKEGTPGGHGDILQMVSGIYMDNNSSGIDIRGNTVANCGKTGLFVHNSHKLVIRNNTFYDNKQAQMNMVHDNGNAARITNVTMKNNVFISRTTSQAIGYMYTRLGGNYGIRDIKEFGSLDSNYYARPLDDNKILRAVTGYNTSKQVITWQTLGDWQQVYSHDKKTKKSSKTLSSTINPDDYLLLVYNASQQSKTVALNGTYVDMKNKTYSGSIALAPYASAVLVKTAATVSNPSTTNQAPVVTLTSPKANATYTAPASVRLTATASDADGSISKVEFYRGSTLILTEYNGAYDKNWSNVPAGTYTITAKAYDNTGKATTSKPVTITIKNNRAPVVTLTSPKANATYTAPASVRLTATASDADGSISKVEFYRGSTLILTEKTAPYDKTWSNVLPGTYTITAKAYDNTGKVTTSTPVTITVKSSSVALASMEGSEVMMAATPATANLRLYPNPAVHSIFVEYGALANNQKATLSIRNIAGSVVKSMAVILSGNGMQVDISSLVPGTYVLTVTGEGFNKTQKFLKTK